jgi:hypothetical protein
MQINKTHANYQSEFDIFADPKKFNAIVATKLPTKKSENLDKKGLRKPLQLHQIDAMYNTPFNVQRFLKMARIYYNAKYDKRNYITLTNEQTQKTILIDFNEDAQDYISIKVFRDTNCHNEYLKLSFKRPIYNTCLFKKIFNYRLL